MSGTTTIFDFPFPGDSDPPAGHTEIQALAEAVEASLRSRGAKAIRSTNQSIPAATTTDVTLPDSEDFDTDAFHNLVTSSNRITVPSAGLAGVYLCVANLIFAANATGIRRLIMLKNGSGINVGDNSAPGSAGQSAALSAAEFLVLGNGDYVSMACYQDSGGALNLSGASLSLMRVPDLS